MPDPLATIWNALEVQGYDPQGPEHKFRANCPAHGGDSHQLRVNEGTDGRALVYCHTNRCSARQVVEALGLRLSDMFPAGHDNARSIASTPNLTPVGMAKKVSTLLAELDEIEEPWVFMVLTRCQFCGAEGAWFRGAGPSNTSNVDCAEGCSERAFTQGLSGKVQLARAEAEITKRRSRAS